MSSARKIFRFIGCEVMAREAYAAAAKSPHRIDVELLERGLHDLAAEEMRAKVQEVIDHAPMGKHYDAILLGYGRCNNALCEITAGDVQLVIPRCHDCIALFFGSRAEWKTYFDTHPGTYFHTAGWCERNPAGDELASISRPAYGLEGVMSKLGLAETYDELVAKHGVENAKYIIDTLGGWESAYRRLCYIRMNAADESGLIEFARARAKEKGWEFDLREGDWALFDALVSGEWNDDDFLVVQPGQTIIARNDDTVLSCE